MQRVTVRSIFVLLLFVGSLSVAIAGIRHRYGLPPTQNPQEYVIPLTVLDGKRFFIPIGSACGNGSILLFESLDGVRVCRTAGSYTKQAEQVLRTLMDEAIVIERGPNLDSAGRVLGERIVFAYVNKHTGRQAAVVWKWCYDGIEYVDGDSLEHVLNFESYFRTEFLGG